LRWLAVIRTKASHNEVWNYIKPIFNDGEIRREFRKSTSPTIKNYIIKSNADLASTTKILINNQLKRYKIDYKIYKNELKK
jgi:hypothetical protein